MDADPMGAFRLGPRCPSGTGYRVPGTGYLDERPGPRRNARLMFRKTRPWGMQNAGWGWREDPASSRIGVMMAATNETPLPRTGLKEGTPYSRAGLGCDSHDAGRL